MVSGRWQGWWLGVDGDRMADGWWRRWIREVVGMDGDGLWMAVDG